MLRAVLQDIQQRSPVGKTKHVVKVILGIFGIASGMRPAEHGNRPLRAAETAQGVCRVGRFGEGADEDYIQSTWQLIEQVLKTGIANERDVVTQLSAPNPDYL